MGKEYIYSNRIFMFPPNKEDTSGHLLNLPNDGKLKLIHATVEENKRGKRNRAQEIHQHDVYHLAVITQGTGNFIIDDQQIDVEPSCLLMISPGVPHCLVRAFGEEIIYNEITFFGEQRDRKNITWSWSKLLSEWTGKPCNLPTCQKITPVLFNELSEHIKTIVSYGFANLPDIGSLIQGTFSQILFSLYKHLVLERQFPQNKDPLELAEEYIKLHFHESFSLKDVAGYAGLSVKHLSRTFKQRFGCPPMQYRRQLAIKQASYLLRSTNYSLQYISEKVGMEDPFYFSRVFKKIYGIPPGIYRQNYYS